MNLVSLVWKLRKIKLTAQRQGDLHHITVSLHLPVESIKLKVTKSSDQGYVQGRPKLKSVQNRRVRVMLSTVDTWC